MKWGAPGTQRPGLLARAPAGVPGQAAGAPPAPPPGILQTAAGAPPGDKERESIASGWADGKTPPFLTRLIPSERQQRSCRQAQKTGSTPKPRAVGERAHSRGPADSPWQRGQPDAARATGRGRGTKTTLSWKGSSIGLQGLSVVGRSNRNNTSFPLLRSFMHRSTDHSAEPGHEAGVG